MERLSTGEGKSMAGLILFMAYVIVLAVAAASELFDLGWFDHPVFK